MHWTHDLDPILFSGGPFTVRWYGLMYLTGYVCGYLLFVRRFRRGLFALNPDQAQTLIIYIMIGMVLGARFLYVTVYDPMNYLQNPGDILAIWKGGLSFHGAVLGMVVGAIFFCKKYGYQFFHVADNMVLAGSLGIFFGRIGNFINGELFGRVSDVPWAIVFPMGGSQARHPSQLYQALGEGLFILFLLLFIEKRERKLGMAPSPSKTKKKKKQTFRWERPGILSSYFVISYGVARFIVEFFRQPDAQLGYFAGYFSMGQILCAIMVGIGIFLLRMVTNHPKPQEYK